MSLNSELQNLIEQHKKEKLEYLRNEIEHKFSPVCATLIKQEMNLAEYILFKITSKSCSCN